MVFIDYYENRNVYGIYLINAGLVNINKITKVSFTKYEEFKNEKYYEFYYEGQSNFSDVYIKESDLAKLKLQN